MIYHNPYARIQEYFALLSANDSDNGKSMQQICESKQIPVKIVRNDFLTIFQWQRSMNLVKNSDKNELAVLFNDESPKYQKICDTYALDELYNNYMDAVPGNDSIQEFEQLITDGILDAVPIIFYDTDADTSNTWTLPLTPDEAAALQSFYSDETDSLSIFDRLKKTYVDTYAIKDSYLYTHNYNNSLNDLLCKINTAIDFHSCLYMKYYSRRKKKFSRFIFRPVKIVYDADENLYSVLSIRNDCNILLVHRLDCIISLETTDKTIHNSMETKLIDHMNQIAPNVWGNNFSCTSDQTADVKVKFFNAANVHEKVKKQLACRTNGKLTQKGDWLYYEDKVYGLNRFRSWIYGYGRAAVVLEPESLRNDIMDSLNKRVGYYE